jgi:phage terminase large subunit-like protein
LADYSCHLSPDGWGRRAVQAAIDWEVDDICVEINYGGDQAIAVLGTAMEKMDVRIPVRKVRASTGKAVRARPVSALSEQERWHHVGVFEELETQLTTWYPELGWSPDRLDALVWGPWHMKLVKPFVSGHGSFGSKEAKRRIG